MSVSIFFQISRYRFFGIPGSILLYTIVFVSVAWLSVRKSISCAKTLYRVNYMINKLPVQGWVNRAFYCSSTLSSILSSTRVLDRFSKSQVPCASLKFGATVHELICIISGKAKFVP